ncbi:hypothetical protein [Actinoplanes sp. URMC 104]|uniref:hypothetical protein n=1 Tax=Actinoplanes sp. URMC 104 TaxID=3423409 RepID=UPI003F1A3C01
MIDAPPPLWDPPRPRRPRLWPAWLGGSLSLLTVLAVAGIVIATVNAGRESRYSKSDVCAALDLAAITARLGVPAPEPQKSTVPGVCRYPVLEPGGLRAGGGGLSVTFFDNALAAWWSWQGQTSEDDGAREVDGLGRSARVTTEEAGVGSVTGCSVQLRVLDSNVTVLSQIVAYGDLASRPCDDLESVTTALIDSTRASLARLA